MGGFLPAKGVDATTLTGYKHPDATVTQRVKPQVDDDVALVSPSAAPFTVFTKHIRRQYEVENYTFDMLSKGDRPRLMTVLGAQTAADTAIEVVAGQGIRCPAFAVLQNTRTGELLWNTAQAVADTLTMTRGIGGGAAAMVDGDELLILNTAHEDATGHAALMSIREDRDFNYTQHIRTAWGLSGRDMATAFFGGSDMSLEEKWHAIDHAKDIELALLMGKRHRIAAGPGGLPVTFTNGLVNSVRTNVWDLGGNVPTKAQFEEFLESVMQRGRGGNLEGTGTKYAFISARWATVIQSWMENGLEYRPMDKIQGLKIAEYQSTHGTLYLVKAPIFTGQALGHLMAICDLNHLRYAYLKGRNTKLYKNIQAPDIDGRQDEYRTDCGLYLEFEEAHGVAKNLALG